MDRIRTAVNRLWGPFEEDRVLHEKPRFAEELAERCSGKLGIVNLRVSKWSYGYQVEHLYRTSHYVLDRLEEAMTGLDADKRPGFWGAGMMVGGFIPRYWFPTIPQLVPLSGSSEDIEPLKSDLAARLKQFPWTFDQIRRGTGRSRHPRMKYLTPSQWMFFFDLHHRHHLSIMHDILCDQ